MTHLRLPQLTFRLTGLSLLLVLILHIPLPAQNHTLQIEPDTLKLKVGDTAQLSVQVLDPDGVVLPDAQVIYFARGRAVEVGRESGMVTAHQGGLHRVIVISPTPGGRSLRADVPVRIQYPPLDHIAFSDVPERVYTGSATEIRADVFDATGFERTDLEISLDSSNPTIATVDAFGQLLALSPGVVTLRAGAGNIQAERRIEVVQSPVQRIELSTETQQARTGDVLTFEARAIDASGSEVPDVPIQFSFQARPLDNLGPSASGQIDDRGRFVAETPGLYTITAHFGGSAANQTIRIVERNVQQEVELVGHAPVMHVHTSDLWVWEGIDGRDYAVTGTWGAYGDAYFWDVTDPSNMIKVDSIRVDARTVNDVKVSEDGRICVLSREGASNRRNGIVILDCTNPSNVRILSEYDDELTGGVHNVFIYRNHVYAVNNGRRYDIINIEDPVNPVRVGRFELDTPGHSIHDVWIKDGIAYSSNWSDGIQLVDVGSATEGGALVESDEAPIPDLRAGLAGGSPGNPVQFAEYKYPSGWNHAAFPFHSESTGTFYVVGGDEAFPYGSDNEDNPTIAAGWLHFVDFSDPTRPDEVARYQVPQAGSHNFWIEDDVLYAAFYNGGLRVVDISGELMGDLYRQGREIAWYIPMHPRGYIPNAAMVWGPQPHKGTIFMSDWNTGLWAVRLVPKAEAGP